MNKLFRKKFSASVVTLLLMSMLMPVLSHAAAYIGFDYNEKNGVLSGGIYTADPDNVTVERIDESGKATPISGKVSVNASTQYDDNNTPYKWVGYSAFVGSDTTKELKITEGKDKKELVVSKGAAGSFYYEDETVALDLYRMRAAEYLSGKKENSYLKSGDKLFTFTPEKSGYQFIQVELPQNNELGAKIDRLAVVPTDFVLSNNNINLIAYASEVQVDSWYDSELQKVVYSDHIFTLRFPVALTKGETYELQLSSSSSGNEIMLPSSNQKYKAVLRYGNQSKLNSLETGAESYYFTSENLTRFNNISFTAESTGPTGPTGPPPTGGPGGGLVIEDPNKDKQVISADSLKNGKDGVVTVAISKDKPQVLLPIKAAEAVGNNKLQLDSEDLSVEIPTMVLAKLQALLPASQLEGAQISFDYKKVLDAAAADLLSKAKTQSGADVKAAGDIYDFSLSVVTKDGKTTVLSQFDEPITISLKAAANHNPAWVGVYYIADDGKLEYVGGKRVGNELKVAIHHFSKYAVLEYNKTFTDVAADYWAAAIIKEMAAKHIVQGVSANQFAPQADVTRAEFAALLVRALGLKATGPASFADVRGSAWYAEAVAAASEAGIVQGKDAATFAPNAKITREEMSALLVRAYEHKAGSKLAAGAEAKFADRSKAAEWALAYIDTAYAAGFIEGRSGNAFAPKAQLTRAESAKAIYTLLIK
ncbi:S-layer homology domain-containing protein [Paenibacillus sp. FJAT-27812]|uniref:S-layer homology domain-containing protein n=1 Tax=Paenibacillus sp. FJAT-27812 TaxID=1684143 RepID=UPI0006A75CAB|nr:S-layer homology domain-containing protein [Paenibacillus sp. FJAT-27812]